MAQSSFEAVNQVYAHCRLLKNMLGMLPDMDLAEAKREMLVLEDLLWQAVKDRR